MEKVTHSRNGLFPFFYFFLFFSIFFLGGGGGGWGKRTFSPTFEYIVFQESKILLSSSFSMSIV